MQTGWKRTADTVSASLRLQLGGMRLSALQKRALEAGLSEQEVEKAVDEDENPKQALIDLIIGAAPGPTDAGSGGAKGDIARRAERPPPVRVT